MGEFSNPLTRCFASTFEMATSMAASHSLLTPNVNHWSDGRTLDVRGHEKRARPGAMRLIQRRRNELEHLGRGGRSIAPPVYEIRYENCLRNVLEVSSGRGIPKAFVLSC